MTKADEMRRRRRASMRPLSGSMINLAQLWWSLRGVS